MNCRRLPGAESAAARQVPPAALQQISTPCALVCKLCLACRGSNMTGLWAVVKNSCGAVCESCQGTSSPGNGLLGRGQRGHSGSRCWVAGEGHALQ